MSHTGVYSVGCLRQAFKNVSFAINSPLTVIKAVSKYPGAKNQSPYYIYKSLFFQGILSAPLARKISADTAGARLKWLERAVFFC